MPRGPTRGFADEGRRTVQLSLSPKYTYRWLKIPLTAAHVLAADATPPCSQRAAGPAPRSPHAHRHRC
jgi:hypothetical protein